MKFSKTAVILGSVLFAMACTPDTTGETNQESPRVYFYYTLNTDGTPGSFICQGVRTLGGDGMNYHGTEIDCVNDAGEVINNLNFSPGSPVYFSKQPLQPGTFLPQETQ